MAKPKRIHILSGALVAMAVTAVVYFSAFGPGKKPPPSGPGYYTGVMRGKGANATFSNEDGTDQRPPPGAKEAKSNPMEGAPKNSDKGAPPSGDMDAKQDAPKGAQLPGP